MADMAGTVVIAVMVEVIVNEARMKEKETVASSARAPAGIRTERLNPSRTRELKKRTVTRDIARNIRKA